MYPGELILIRSIYNNFYITFSWLQRFNNYLDSCYQWQSDGFYSVLDKVVRIVVRSRDKFSYQVYLFLIITEWLYNTGYSLRRPIFSHCLVCSKNSSYFLVIKSLLRTVIVEIFSSDMHLVPLLKVGFEYSEINM